MTKQVILYGNTIKLQRVQHRHMVVWTNKPEEVLRDLKRIAAKRKKVVKITKSIFGRSLTKIEDKGELT